jgi:hypothetical protein
MVSEIAENAFRSRSVVGLLVLFEMVDDGVPGIVLERAGGIS